MKYLIKDTRMNMYVKKAQCGYLNWTTKLDDAKLFAKRTTALTTISKYNIPNAEVVVANYSVSLEKVNGHGQVVHELRSDEAD